MDTVIYPKAWWTSKTIQGIIISVVAKGYDLLAHRYGWKAWDISDADFVTNLLTLLGFAWTGYGLRTSDRPIGNPSVPVVKPAVVAGTASGEVPVK